MKDALAGSRSLLLTLAATRKPGLGLQLLNIYNESDPYFRDAPLLLLDCVRELEFNIERFHLQLPRTFLESSAIVIILSVLTRIFLVGVHLTTPPNTLVT